MQLSKFFEITAQPFQCFSPLMPLPPSPPSLTHSSPSPYPFIPFPYPPLPLTFPFPTSSHAGKWTHKFDEKHTKPDVFYEPPSSTKASEATAATCTAEYMHSRQHMRIASHEGHALCMAALPYVLGAGEGDEAVDMLILLPDARDGLPSLEVCRSSNLYFAFGCNFDEFGCNFEVLLMNLDVIWVLHSVFTGEQH